MDDCTYQHRIVWIICELFCW